MRFIDPFTEFDRIMQGATGPGTMPMDVFERDGDYMVRFDLAGIDPDDISLTVEHQVLTVTVERQWEDTEDVNWLVRERPSGRHSRQLRLSRKLDAAAMKASYDNGVLSVLIPTREEAKPFSVEIARDVPLALDN
ncbi:MAG: Hsp20/alpha crystallin family protein [Acidimicrobiia bacterium]|nr:Hsp20/alpha crystallin family protein [Acidimicrobiia bacterium]